MVAASMLTEALDGKAPEENNRMGLEDVEEMMGVGLS